MNIKIIAGIIMIALGVIGLAYQGITYTQKEKVLDLGPIQATKETEKTLPLPPIAGVILLVGGIAVVFFSRNR